MIGRGCGCARADRGEQSFACCRCGSPLTAAAFRRIEADLSRRRMLGGAAATLALFAGFGLAPRPARAQVPPRPLLLTNLRLFDGRDLRVRDGVDVLIEGGRIAALPASGQGPIEAERSIAGGAP